MKAKLQKCTGLTQNYFLKSECLFRAYSLRIIFSSLLSHNPLHFEPQLQIYLRTTSLYKY